MKKIGPTIVDPHITNQEEIKRIACRAIIQDGNNLLMVYCKYFNDYTFPGGGINKSETFEECLIREVEEEVGVIIKDIIPFGYITEKWVWEKDKTKFINQRSYFFKASILKKTKTHLESYEIDYGFMPKWVDIDQAIAQDIIVRDSWSEADYEGVQVRELRVLNKLKREMEQNNK